MGHNIPDLRGQRLALGWTVEELAEQSQVAVPVIVELERGGDCEQHEVEQVRQALTAFEAGVVADEAAAEAAFQKSKSKKK